MRRPEGLGSNSFHVRRRQGHPAFRAARRGKTLYAQALARTCGVELIVASAAHCQSAAGQGGTGR